MTAKKVKTTTPKTPKYENTFGNALKNFWTDYTGWGRATRMEYWAATLIYSIVASFTIMLIPGINILWFCATLVPGFCLIARRLHDINKSNWNLLWLLLPYIGFIILIVFLCLPGDTKPNKFGAPRI